jgi:ribosomal protein L11 methyltransferase
MNYYECTFTCTSAAPIEAEALYDILAAELGETGFESFVVAANELKGYIPETMYDTEKLERQLATFPLEGVTFRFTASYIEDKDWNEEWERNYFHPITIGDACIIHASFHAAPSGFAYDIIIDPKMAFGTGNHETTLLMLTEILRTELKGKEVLDMGCGTAVLAILAAKRGAARIVAVDIDEWAYRNALENIQLNHAEGIETLWGGAERISRLEPFDVVFANINRNILLGDIGHYAQCMKPGALLLMSGFYTEDIPVIEAACNQNGLRLLTSAEKNRWALVKTQRNNII